MVLSKLLEQALEGGKVSQKELADRLQISQALVSRVRNGYVPSQRATLKRIVNGLVKPEDTEEVLAEIERANGPRFEPGQQSAHEPRLPEALRSLPSGELLQEELAVWLGLLCNSPAHAKQLEREYELIDEMLGLESKQDTGDRDLLVSHAARVLQYSSRLGIPERSMGVTRKYRAPMIDSPEGALIVIVSTLAHVLCLDQKLSDGNRPPYHLRALTFPDRLGKWFDKPGDAYRAQARFIATEMYRDSPYWTQPLAESQSIQAQSMSPMVLYSARLLRMSDALDVSHRFVPDLVTEIFSRLRFDLGLSIYFRRTFERGEKLLDEEYTVVRGDTVRLRWGVVPASIGAPEPATAILDEAMRRAQRIVHEELQAVLERISHCDPFSGAPDQAGTVARLGSSIADEARPLPNLHVVSEHIRSPWKAVRLEHLAFALAPLAIAQQGSDSDAEIAALCLAPILSSHLASEDEGLKHLPTSEVSTASRTTKPREVFREYTARLAALRQNSAAISRVSALATSDAVVDSDGLDPAELAAAVSRQMEKGKARGAAWSIDATSVPDDNRDLVVFIFGVSRPVAHYLATVIGRLRSLGRVLHVYPIYCKRSYQPWAAADRNHSIPTPRPQELIVPEDQGETMRRALGAAMRDRGIPTASLHWNPTTDAFRLPRICFELGERSQLELVFGARMFSLKPTPNAVTIYGCHALALLCKDLNVRRRLITWSERLLHPTAEYNPLESWFSYAITPHPDSENERVPIECIDFINTETEQLEGAKARDRLAPHA